MSSKSSFFSINITVINKIVAFFVNLTLGTTLEHCSWEQLMGEISFTISFQPGSTAKDFKQQKC